MFRAFVMTSLIAAVCLGMDKQADAQQPTTGSPRFKAGPYYTSVFSSTRYRLKVKVVSFNPATMQSTTATYVGEGIPSFTVVPIVSVAPAPMSMYMHVLDGWVTLPDVAQAVVGGKQVSGIVEASTDGVAWQYAGTAIWDETYTGP